MLRTTAKRGAGRPRSNTWFCFFSAQAAVVGCQQSRLGLSPSQRTQSLLEPSCKRASARDPNRGARRPASREPQPVTSKPGSPARAASAATRVSAAANSSRGTILAGTGVPWWASRGLVPPSKQAGRDAALATSSLTTAEPTNQLCCRDVLAEFSLQARPLLVGCSHDHPRPVLYMREGAYGMAWRPC